VEKIELRETGIDMSLKTNGLTNLIAELSGLPLPIWPIKERSNNDNKTNYYSGREWQLAYSHSHDSPADAGQETNNYARDLGRQI